jgi:hypothetical protein
MSVALLSSLILAGAALPAADSAAIDARVREIYAPYANPSNTRSAWQYRAFSTETAALIARWRRVAPKDEIDDLSDGDWFCLCQDWENLRATVRSRRLDRPGRATLRVEIEVGPRQLRTATMTFVRERRGWMLDDIVARDFPAGLKQTLRDTIRTDKRR